MLEDYLPRRALWWRPMLDGCPIIDALCDA